MRRLRDADLCCSMWFLKALRRMSFPPPLREKRLAAALRDLSLGMTKILFSAQHSLLSYILSPMFCNLAASPEMN